MPHGTLTPLGRQLRSVLASISRPSPNTPNANLHSIRRRDASIHTPAWSGHPRLLHQSTVTNASAATVASYNPHAVAARPEPSKPTQDGRPFRKVSRNKLHRRPRVGHVTEALKDVGNHKAVPYSPRKRSIDLSYMNVQSRDAVKDYRKTQQRRAQNPVRASPPSASHELSLQRILASLIRHRAKADDYLEADWNRPFELSHREEGFLRSKGVSLDDISAWADIVTAQDALPAAQLLAHRARKFGPDSVPIFVYLHLLRRQYISARALRILLLSFLDLFRHRETLIGDKSPIILATIRLLRHAREVWPQAMQSIVDMLLRHYQHQQQKRLDLDDTILRSKAFFLNKVMTLVSLSTATEPFKNQRYQEATIVSILQYMAQHDPPLPINREGYRAVVRTQLAQRKTEAEQEWARLKKLSWPPWKEDRTAMDSLITADEHGISRAAATLKRMRDAGYAFGDWEKSAMLYAGWDIDGTPTIQLRALLGSSLPRRRPDHQGENHEAWAARIESTRTMQEAWACYLSWEDAKLPPDQNVFLAVMKKLRDEERRPQVDIDRDLRDTETGRWQLLPGDAREISPLPPSTHLETYTRTQPPTLEDFYNTMVTRGISFEGSCLAFLISNSSFKLAGRVIQDSTSQYPSISSLLQLHGPYETSGLPEPLLVAILEHFARNHLMRRITYTKTTWSTPLPARLYDPSIQDDVGLHLHPQYSLTLVIDILRTQPILSRPAWNAVLHPYTRKKALQEAGKVFIQTTGDGRQRKPVPADMEKHVGAMDAFTWTRIVFNMMRARGIDLDITGFHQLSLATQRMAVGVWSVLEKCNEARTDDEDPAWRERRLKQAEVLTRDMLKHSQVLRREFAILVGLEHDSSQTTRHGIDIPSFLAITPAAILHAYIQTLGWLGDYDGLMEAVMWMRDHRRELKDRQDQDRNGRDMMQLSVAAFRAFMERSWVSAEDDGGALLAQWRRPAEPQLIDAVRDVVESVEEWGGWASDEEVERYISKDRFDSTRGKGNMNDAKA